MGMEVTHCVEGCGNPLTEEDLQRYPETLSRPWPAEKQTASNNNIDRINMRARCSQCYASKYSHYSPISYRWDLADYRESTATFKAWDGKECTEVKVPIIKNGQVKAIMERDLFFLDKANALSDGNQWLAENVAKTYGSGGEMLCLLNNADRRIMDYDCEGSIHQTPRDRGPYLDSAYGRQERAFGYSHLDPSKVRFISETGKDLGNIEVGTRGLVKDGRNVHDRLAASEMSQNDRGGNTPQTVEMITQTFPLPEFKKTKKPTRRNNPFILDEHHATAALISGSSRSKSKPKPGLSDSMPVPLPIPSLSDSVIETGNGPQGFMSTYPNAMPKPMTAIPASEPDIELSSMMTRMNIKSQNATFTDHNSMSLHMAATANPYPSPFENQPLDSFSYGDSFAFNTDMAVPAIPDLGVTAASTTNISTKRRSRRQGAKYH